MRSIILLIGPSQVGKTTILDHLLGNMQNDLRRVVTTTSRSPRKGEKEGEDYQFVSRDQFETMIGHERMIEHNEYSGNLYGTPNSAYTNIFAAGKIPIQIIDVNGALAIQKYCKAENIECITVFIEPPSMDVLAKRLKGFPDAEQRLATAEDELAYRHVFDYVVTNKRIASTVAMIANYLSNRGIGYV